MAERESTAVVNPLVWSESSGPLEATATPQTWTDRRAMKAGCQRLNLPRGINDIASGRRSRAECPDQGPTRLTQAALSDREYGHRAARRIPWKAQMQWLLMKGARGCRGSGRVCQPAVSPTSYPDHTLKFPWSCSQQPTPLSTHSTHQPPSRLKLCPLRNIGRFDI